MRANLEGLNELLGLLQAFGIRHLASVNRDPREQWPDEPGFLLCDPPPKTAEQLGRRFGQNAILCGHLGASPQLTWLIE